VRSQIQLNEGEKTESIVSRIKGRTGEQSGWAPTKVLDTSELGTEVLLAGRLLAECRGGLTKMSCSDIKGTRFAGTRGCIRCNIQRGEEREDRRGRRKGLSNEKTLERKGGSRDPNEESRKRRVVIIAMRR